MFEGDSADTCQKNYITSKVGRAEGISFADPGKRTSIGAGGNFRLLSICWEGVVGWGWDEFV